MTNYKKQLGYVLDNKNICINGYLNNSILFQNNNGKIDKQRKAKLNHNNKGVYFIFEGKRNYVFINENQEMKLEEVKSNELSQMIGDVGFLIAGLQTTKTKSLNELNEKKYKPQSDFAKWLHSLVKTTINNKIQKDYTEVIELLNQNSDLITLARNKVKETFNKLFGEENLKCNKINVDKVFGESEISKYSFLAKENGFNSNDIDMLVQSIIYSVLIENKRYENAA